jgi:hypothetical protein
MTSTAKIPLWCSSSPLHSRLIHDAPLSQWHHIYTINYNYLTLTICRSNLVYLARWAARGGPCKHPLPGCTTRAFQLTFPLKTAPVWRVGGSWLCLCPRHGFRTEGGGEPPYALTFGMEIHENDARFRRWGSVLGITGYSAVNSPPPPRKTVLIPIREHAMRARPVRSGRLSRPGRGGGYEEESTSSAALCGQGQAPAPTPGVRATTVPCPGSVASWLVHVHHRLTRAVGDPHQNPQHKMK